MAWSFSAGETMLLITTLGTALGTLMTAWRTGRVESKQAVVAQKVDTVTAKVEEVHQLANSRLTKIESELATARADLAAALAAMAHAETVRSTLASEAAARASPPA